MNKHFDIIIIGSGMGGYLLAQSIRQQSAQKRIAIITKTDGRFYPKPMLSTALYHQKTPEMIMTATASEMAAKYDLEIITHTEVKAVDCAQKKLEIDGQIIRYDALVMATGSHANEIPGLRPVNGYISVNSMEDYEQLIDQLSQTKNLLIIGSGLVGVEFAHDLLHAGYKVSMVSQTPQALWGLVPSEIGGRCRDHLVGMGLDWFEDPGVKAVHEDHQRVAVSFSSRAAASYDLVLSAIGIKPNIALAQEIGLSTQRGIVADQYGRCSSKDVFAIGDCAQIYGLNLTYVAPIKQQAQAIAKTLTGEQTPIHYPAMPVVVKTPTYPLTLVPVREAEVIGNWQPQAYPDKTGIISAFYDKDQLKGFALAGTATKERNHWLSKMPPSIVSKS